MSDVKSESLRLFGLSLQLPPLLLVLMVAVLMVLSPPLLEVNQHSVWQWLAGSACVLLGSGVCLAAVWIFRQSRTTVSPVSPGLTSALVVQGVYRWSRNPMYLGFALWLLGLALVLGKLSGLLWCAVFVGYLQRYQIKPEEQILGAKFGQSFEAYCAQVGRWCGRSGV